MLSEIHPHTKVVSDYTKIASYEAQLSFPFIPDYCKSLVIFKPLIFFYFAHFQFVNFVPINVKKFNDES